MDKDQFKEWKRNEVTKEVLEWLRNQRLHLLESWAAGQFTSADGTATLQRNSEAIGQAQAYETMINLEYEDMETT